MGSDKALLSWAGETLLQHTLAIARDACGQAVICGARSLYGKFGEVIEDTEPGHGPLSGIQAALHATQSELNLILSVDVPLMTAEFLSWFLQQARSGEQLNHQLPRRKDGRSRCARLYRTWRATVDEAMENGDYQDRRLFPRYHDAYHYGTRDCTRRVSSRPSLQRQYSGRLQIAYYKRPQGEVAGGGQAQVEQPKSPTSTFSTVQSLWQQCDPQ